MSKIICSKENMILRKDRANKVFTLDFNIHNPNTSIAKFFNIDSFEEMMKLNMDAIEHFKIEKVSDTEANFLMIFQHMGKDMGMDQRYVYLNMKQFNTSNNTIQFKSESIPYLGDIPSKLESFYSEYSLLTIEFTDEHSATLHFESKMDTEDELPIYFENIAGIIMKKIFLNIKLHIENSQ